LSRPNVEAAFVVDDMAGEALLASFLCIARVYACVQFGGVPSAYSLRVQIIDDSEGESQPSVLLELRDKEGISIAGMSA
jgi:hypothetical protein